MNAQTLSFSQHVNAPATEAYHAFTNATALRQWLCDVATVSPRPGGRIYLWWHSGYYTSGEFTAVQAGEMLSISWQGRGEPGPTEVKVTFDADDGGSLVTVEHSGIGDGEEWSKVIPEIEKGWKNGLENLASVLETGEDLRFVLRPMVGIMFDSFDAEQAKKLGVPVSEGARLSDTVEGMGAQAAGLQKNDVIVSIAGEPAIDWNSFAKVLGGHRAGEEVEVVFYRGAEKKSVTMQLSKRPIPSIPATPHEMADLAEQQYRGMEADLDEFLESVTEEEASFQQAPDEWSVKGSLAHLIHGERGYQHWIAELINDQERFSDDWGDNINAQVEGTLAAFPTVEDLVAEYKRTHVETVAFLAHLPDKFVARKGSYWQIAYSVAESFRSHFDTHLEQIKEALEGARAAVIA